MKQDVPDREIETGVRSASHYTDNVIPYLNAWTRAGERCALITLVGIEGSAPRALGAQMAVAESGKWAGYLSGGCLEQAVVQEAIQAIEAGKCRLVRYGKGSPYFDIRLPCGSGLDVLIQPSLKDETIAGIQACLENREAAALSINIATGEARVEPVASADGPHLAPRKEGDIFIRPYTPPLRCLIVGQSPIAVLLAELAAGAGFETIFCTPDPEQMPALPSSIRVRGFQPPFTLPADAWTAAIIAFHDHDREMPALERLLRAPCFFLGAIGSRRAHEARVLGLREAGFSDADIARIRSPAGIIPGLKSAPYAALSILAEIIAVAHHHRLIA